MKGKDGNILTINPRVTLAEIHNFGIKTDCSPDFDVFLFQDMLINEMVRTLVTCVTPDEWEVDFSSRKEDPKV